MLDHRDNESSTRREPVFGKGALPFVIVLVLTLVVGWAANRWVGDPVYRWIAGHPQNDPFCEQPESGPDCVPRAQ